MIPLRIINDAKQRVLKRESLKVQKLIDEGLDTPVVDGVSFMRQCTRYFDKKYTEEYRDNYKYSDLDNGKTTRPIFKWDGNDLILDNSKTNRRFFLILPHPYAPHFAINAQLAKKMGWFTRESNGDYKIGPNLLMIFPDGKVPAKDDADWKSSDGNPLYYKPVNSDQHIELSMRVNWKFLNLNVAFRSVMKEPTRSLHIYSDAASSTIVGNKMTVYCGKSSIIVKDVVPSILNLFIFTTYPFAIK